MSPSEEFIELVVPLDIRYKWSAGPHMQEFFLGLKEGKLIGNKCPKCGHALIPPVPVCAKCHAGMGDFMEFSPRGTVISFSFVADPIFDSGTGDWRPVPYTIASVVLDGEPDAAFFHKLEEANPEKVKVGMRVEAVFKPKQERQGDMQDIMHFRTIEA